MRYGWSLDRSSWEACSVADKPWGKTKLNPLHRDTVPLSPGVYAICARPAVLTEGIFDHLYNAVYVGRARGSNGLRQRFLAHSTHPGAELRRAAACYGALDYWYLELKESEVDHAEAMLIECLGPVVNRITGAIQARIGSSRPA